MSGLCVYDLEGWFPVARSSPNGLVTEDFMAPGARPQSFGGCLGACGSSRWNEKSPSRCKGALLEAVKESEERSTPSLADSMGRDPLARRCRLCKDDPALVIRLRGVGSATDDLDVVGQILLCEASSGDAVALRTLSPGFEYIPWCRRGQRYPYSDNSG